MRFLFLVPSYHSRVYATPSGVGIVATVAKHAGFDVRVLLSISGETESDFNRRAVEIIRKEKINVVAIGAMSASYPKTERLLRLGAQEGCTTILGGYIVDASPELVAGNIGADYCIVGEGEYTFVELAKALENGLPTENINGLIYKRGDSLVFPPRREPVRDLDELPFIDGDLVHFEQSLKAGVGRLYMPLSRSCPYQCTFCYHLKGSYYRAHSLDYAFRQLDYNLEKYGDLIKTVHFDDEMLNVDFERLKEFCRRFKSYSLSFSCTTRMDVVDEQTIILLKEANCCSITYGLESASNKILKSMNKKLTIEKATEIMELTKKHGIPISASLIVGDIEDDEDTVRESEEYYKKYGAEFGLGITRIRVFPGTRVYKYAVENGIIKDELLFLQQGCPYINVSKLSDEIYDLLPGKYAIYKRSVNTLLHKPIETQPPKITLYKGGKMDYSLVCQKCLKWHELSLDLHLYFNQHNRFVHPICPYCHQREDLRMSDILPLRNPDVFLMHKLAESVFRKYKGKKIAIWGFTHEMRNLLILSQHLRDSIVIIVDMQHENFKQEQYCGLSVESPKMLSDVKFDFILTGAYNRKDEIVEQLKDMNKLAPFIDYD